VPKEKGNLTREKKGDILIEILKKKERVEVRGKGEKRKVVHVEEGKGRGFTGAIKGKTRFPMPIALGRDENLSEKEEALHQREKRSV